MRVQIISTYYWPEHTGNAPYVTQLAEHLSAKHQVTVVAGWPHYPAWKVEAPWRKWRSVEGSSNLLVVRLAHYVPSRQDSVRRALYEFIFATRAVVEGLRHRPDVVIGFVPTLMTSLAGAAVAKRFRAPLGLVVQDLVGRAALHSGIRGGTRAAGASAALEGYGLRSAQGIATIHARFADILATDYHIDPSSVKAIYNWSHIDMPRQDRARARRAFGWNDGEVVVLHSGNMGLKQDLANVIEAAKIAELQAPGVRFVLAGNGSQRASLLELAGQLTNVEIRDAVHEGEFPDFLAAADLLLVNERSGTREMSVPSKLTSYFMAGRPVLAATESDSVTADIIRDSGGGVICRPGDPAALVRAVVEAARTPNLDQIGRAGRAFAMSNLSKEGAMRQYDTWIESLLHAR